MLTSILRITTTTTTTTTAASLMTTPKKTLSSTTPPSPTSKTPHSFPSKKRPRTKPNPTSSKDTVPFNTWVPLNLPKSELSLPLTFPSGQTFRWKSTGPLQYTGVINSHLISLKHLDSGHVAYLVHNPDPAGPVQARSGISDFLNLGISLSDLWQEFSKVDTRFAELAPHLQGARVLRQHPLECLMQFLCSSNNNIGRITKMVDFLSSLGAPLGRVFGSEYSVFPTLERLAEVTEEELRGAGFGYRAKYIVAAVKTLVRKPGGGVEWLLSLREKGTDEAIQALCGLAGVGAKVGACVALFSLDKHDAVPVDTHVGRIATTYLFPELTGVRMSPNLCSRVADAFVERYGKYAGWAQTLLFVAELPSQKALIPSEVQSVKEKKAKKSSKKKKRKDESDDEPELSAGSSEGKEDAE